MPKRGATSRTCPAPGAAGGFGFGCMALLGGTLRPGIETLLDLTGFDRLLERADLVITGEGRLDGQSLRGKVISGVAAARRGTSPSSPSSAASRTTRCRLRTRCGRDVLHRPRGAAVSGICPRSAADYRATLRDVLRVWHWPRRVILTDLHPIFSA